MAVPTYDSGEAVTFGDRFDSSDGIEGFGEEGGSRHARMLGNTNLNTLGDLHALQQLCDRQARGVRGVFEPLLRRQPRIIAEPLRVERFEDYLNALPAGIASFNILRMAPLNGNAMLVMQGSLVLSMVDLFFGGAGVAPQHLPNEFTATEDALAKRAATGVIDVMNRSWVELAELRFEPGPTESNRRMLSHLDADDPVVVSRFELTMGDGGTSPVDIVYPVAALKPLAARLCAKVQSRRSGGDPRWYSALTRAVMDVPLPVRSVLAEPQVPLSTLMNLKVGDVIPIELAATIPLQVAKQRFGHGIIGHSNGRTAIRMDGIDQFEDEDQS